MSEKPRVTVVGSGGTVSFEGRHSLDLVEYLDYARRQHVDELLARFPELPDAAEIRSVDYRAISSSGIAPSDWLALNEVVHEVAGADPAPDGIVVTHGTATLEETVYFLGLTVKVPQTVVVIGAQRPSNALASDAGMNLLNAVRVAGSPETRGLGALTVLNDEIQAARDVTKTSTFRLQTFRSPDTGPLGYADPDGRVVVYRRPTRRHAPDTEFDVRGRTELPRVDIVYSYAGADAAAIDAFVAAGAEAIVVAGVPPGLPTPAQRTALEGARERGVIVVQSSRGGSGRVAQRTVLTEHGIVAADNLNPQKARVLAMLALTVTREPREIERIFATY
jgi:L-asparaginase